MIGAPTQLDLFGEVDPDDERCADPWCGWPLRWHDPVTGEIHLPTDPVDRAAGDYYDRPACCRFCRGEDTVYALLYAAGGHHLRGPWATRDQQCALQRFGGAA